MTSVEQFDPIPSWHGRIQVDAGTAGEGALGVPVTADGAPSAPAPARDVLTAAGFAGAVGQALPLTDTARPTVVYGTGSGPVQAAAMRDAAAAFARAASGHNRLTLQLPPGGDQRTLAQAAVEGALLARYQFSGLRRELDMTPVDQVTIIGDDAAAARDGAATGLVTARATAMARDLANSPPSMLTAALMGEVARSLSGECGLTVETFDKQQLLDMGCGGLLGVNAGSVDEPRMIKLRYVPDGAPTGRLALVGKGIMYDSGGIALKPADAVHATMKNDMSGAGAILGAMAVLQQLRCRTAVTGYLMCTDNMPSGSATKLGDVLTIRDGTTVEVINTDAEGRLVMADALVLAREEPCDAIVDIATLTGACLRALGAQIAGVFGNDQSLVDRLLASAATVDEPAWQLPLAHRYRAEMNSDVADIKNMGGANGAAIHAALFLAEFVGQTPWAHIDIAGTAQNDAAASWRPAGCTGYGARLLADFACAFTAPAS